MNMTNLADQIRAGIPNDCFSDLDLSLLISGTQNRRYALVKRAIAKGDLISLRRGLYCLGEKYRKQPLDLFAIAQRIYGPSYISLESALSYHGWIPEAVFTITSVSMKRSREFKTAMGVFSFNSVRSDPFLTAVELQGEGSDSFFLARPWKALADYVYVHKRDWSGLHPLMESLRIEKKNLEKVDLNELREIRESFRSRRVRKFIDGIIKECS